MEIDPETETINHCILCPDAEIDTDQEFGRLLNLIPPYGVKCCTNCGLRWLSPRPTAKGYRALYSYHNYFEGPDVVEQYSELVKLRLRAYAHRIREMESHFHEKQSLSILDVGAATGEFVNEAVRMGHRAEGLELSQGAREQAKKRYSIDLFAGELGDIGGRQSYDVIHMNHVFEHLPNPLGTMEMCHALLKRNGLLVLEVPQEFYNDLDRLKKLLGLKRKTEFNAYSLHHTYFYAPRTLAQLTRQCGFQIRRLRTRNPAVTPLVPFKLKNLFLRCYLWLADKTHQGGNIIEVFAVKKVSGQPG